MRHEQTIQQNCVRWFRLQHPDKILFAVNNNARGGRITDKRAGGIAKSMGVLAGVSDLVLCHNGTTTFIEVKTPTGKQGDSQKRFEQICKLTKFDYRIVRSFDEFQTLINDIL